MESKRKMTEAEKNCLKEKIINLVNGIDEEKFLREINIIMSDYIKKKPE